LAGFYSKILSIFVVAVHSSIVARLGAFTSSKLLWWDETPGLSGGWKILEPSRSEF